MPSDILLTDYLLNLHKIIQALFMKLFNLLLQLSFLLCFPSCIRLSEPSGREPVTCRYARYFDILEDGSSIVVISPFDGSSDTLKIEEPMDNIICMSSSSVAALSEIGADSVITAVSGAAYLTNPSVRTRHDIGYDASLDYERIISLNPDLLVTYTVSGAEPPYIIKLRDSGVPLLVIHDHLEMHPLARAEYLRLFGALTGLSHKADSVFFHVCERYEAIAKPADEMQRVKVLMNIPYGDAWYIPGQDSYMSRLIRDAGGEVLGTEPGKSKSSVITLEQAYALSQEADLWLNPGFCRTREELGAVHQLFPSFGPLAKGLPVYNNTLRKTPEGGNDFWESGSVRPDLVLEDLLLIMSSLSDPASQDGGLKYHLQLK